MTSVDYNDPEQWSISITASEYGYHVSLVAGVMQYGPSGGYIARRTLRGALRTGKRMLRRKKAELRDIHDRQTKIERMSNEY